ncbi:TldD/PmbA family protein [Mycoplasmatota bacterium]|nr:TldD/PmbA family protein [Mycoplasmatota bacterium]
MKAELSSYLSKHRELAKGLVDTLLKTYEYVSILGVDTKGKTYAVSRKGSSINDSMWSERGYVLRVFNGINYSEYSFNEFQEKDIRSIIDEVKEIVEGDVKRLKGQNVKFSDYPLIEESLIKDSLIKEVKVLPSTVSAKTKIEKITQIMNDGLKLSDQLIDFRVVYEEVHISKIFYSAKKDLSQSIVYTTAAMVPIVKKDNDIKYSFKSYSGLKGFELLEDLDGLEKLVEDTIKLLDAERVVPGEYEIICNPAVAGLIAHEAFGHGVEMDMFVKNRAKGVEFLGKPIAGKKVSMKDGALSAEEVGTYLFDDEGTLGTDTTVINESVLESGISDLLSAMKLGTKPTGNGRRESFEKKVYARMTNTFFVPGNDELEDMIASIKKGYLLEDYNSGMEDPKNWGIQCMIAMGREIIDGKLTGKIIAPVLMTGYVPDLLKSISMVSDGLELSGSGACGKGYKEYVKTSTGGTYIKAVGRLG